MRGRLEQRVAEGRDTGLKLRLAEPDQRLAELAAVRAAGLLGRVCEILRRLGRSEVLERLLPAFSA